MSIDHVARAKQAWPILANLANNNSAPITYGELCQKLGLHHRSATWFLGVIQSHCHHNDLPALQAFVVNNRTKLPGKGYTGSKCNKSAHAKELAKVVAVKWPLQAPNF